MNAPNGDLAAIVILLGLFNLFYPNVKVYPNETDFFPFYDTLSGDNKL